MDIIKIFEKFPSQASCLAYLEHLRWGEHPVCPYCKSDKQTPLRKEHRYHCNTCNTSYSVTVRTIFHRTHLPLQKWLLAVSIILNAKKGISARQLAHHLHVNRNTAWRISMKIREAMSERNQRELLQGVVEMDETYVGGKPRRGQNDNTHNPRGRGTSKVPVVGMRERGGNVKAEAVRRGGLTAKRLRRLVRGNVDTKNALLITDEWPSYKGMSKILPHRTINHTLWYVQGDIHTNSIESFWAILKRGIIGQFHRVSLKHLPKYIDEFCYRFNNRDNPMAFQYTLARGVGTA